MSPNNVQVSVFYREATLHRALLLILSRMNNRSYLHPLTEMCVCGVAQTCSYISVCVCGERVICKETLADRLEQVYFKTTRLLNR
jgi:hypothetical protein